MTDSLSPSSGYPKNWVIATASKGASLNGSSGKRTTLGQLVIDILQGCDLFRFPCECSILKDLIYHMFTPTCGVGNNCGKKMLVAVPPRLGAPQTEIAISFLNVFLGRLMAELNYVSLFWFNLWYFGVGG